MRVKVSVLGHFGEGLNLLNGQTVKTKIVTEELQNQLGLNQIIKFDTHGGWKMLLKAPFQIFQALKKSTNVLIFPAHNGLRVYAPLLSCLRCFFKNRKIHYIVIGGWLPEFLLKRRGLTTLLKKFDGIYVETKTMKRALELQGFSNVFVMPNCKKLKILSEDELVFQYKAPYKLCTFSRVMKEKGIEDAVNTVISVNKLLGYQAYSLDIYGQIDSNQTDWFDTLKTTFPTYIKYKGVVDFEKSTDTLKEYFALLFPTKFYTEGIPGTIIDAYAAGVPVISAQWESYSDVVDEGLTGIGYSFDNIRLFENILLNIESNPLIILDLKKSCINKACVYIPEIAIKPLTENL